jgi:exodeoxyribonuclease VII large subunit
MSKAWRGGHGRHGGAIRRRGGSELRSAARALPSADTVLAVPRQRLDQAAQSLRRALRANAQIHHMSFSRIGGRLNPHLLRSQLERRRERFAGLASRLRSGVAATIDAYRSRLARERERTGVLAGRAQRAVRNLIAVRRARSERDGQLLAALSYRGVLARGFALVRDGAGHPLRAAAAVSSGMAIEIEFSDGRVAARAEGGPAAAMPAADLPKPRTRRDGGPGQGSLF